MRRPFLASFVLLAAFIAVACGGTSENDLTSTPTTRADGGTNDSGISLVDQTADNTTTADAGIATDAETVTEDAATDDAETTDTAPKAVICRATATLPCLTGLPSICETGLKTCSDDGTTWSACKPSVTPSSVAEVCDNGQDDDCDGLTDWDDAESCGGPVIGHVERIYYDGEKHQHYLEGWACFKSYNVSIDVGVYVSGAETPIVTGTANLATEADIRAPAKCDTPTDGAGHRFSIAIPLETGQELAGKILVAKGYSPLPAEVTSANEALGDMDLTSPNQLLVPLPATTPIVHSATYCVNAKNTGASTYPWVLELPTCKTPRLTSTQAWTPDVVKKSTVMIRSSEDQCFERYYVNDSTGGLRLTACDDGDEYQQWQIVQIAGNNYQFKGRIRLSALHTYGTFCVATSKSMPVTLASCDTADSNQHWSFDW